LGRVLDQDGARGPAARQRLRAAALRDRAAARRHRPLGLVPAPLDHEPRAVVSRPAVRRAAALDGLTPQGIEPPGPESWMVDGFDARPFDEEGYYGPQVAWYRGRDGRCAGRTRRSRGRGLTAASRRGRT